MNKKIIVLVVGLTMSGIKAMNFMKNNNFASLDLSEKYFIRPFIQIIEDPKNEDQTTLIDKLRKCYNDQPWDKKAKKQFADIVDRLNVPVFYRTLNYIKIGSCDPADKARYYYIQPSVLQRSPTLQSIVGEYECKQLQSSDLSTEAKILPNINAQQLEIALNVLFNTVDFNNVLKDLYTAADYVLIAHYLNPADSVANNCAECFVELLVKEDTLKKFSAKDQKLSECLTHISENSKLHNIILEKMKMPDVEDIKEYFPSNDNKEKENRLAEKISPNNLFKATFTLKGSVELVNINNQKRIKKIKKVKSFDFTLDSKFLWIIHYFQSLRNTKNRTNYDALELINTENGSAFIQQKASKNSTFVLSSDKKFIWIIQDRQKIVPLLEKSDKKQNEKFIKLLKVEDDRIKTREFKTDGNFYVSPDGKSALILNENCDGTLINAYNNDALEINGIHSYLFSPGNKFLWIKNNDKGQLINLEDSKVLKELDKVASVGFSPHDKFLWISRQDSVNENSTLDLMRINRDLFVENIADHIVSAKFSPDDKWLCVTCKDCSAKLINLDTNEITEIEDISNTADINFSSDSKWLSFSGSRLISLVMLAHQPKTIAEALSKLSQ